MSNITKQEILEAIRETAQKNGGKPLGTARFGRETGITKYEWKKYWARFGEALTEAGFTPNQLQGAYDDEFLFEKVISVMRKLKRFPTYDELRIQKTHDPEFPSRNVFTDFGPKQKLAEGIIEYCKDKPDCKLIVETCQAVLNSVQKEKASEADEVDLGEVYLFKSGRYFKIGKTKDTVRRGTELRIQLPEKCVLIHSIKTDDPSGVEAYWHRRFESKRMNGEWFDLNASEVKAFKCWRHLV